MEPERREKIKKWLKNTALLAGGAGAGAAAVTGIDHLAKKYAPNISPSAKKYVLGPLLGLAFVGSRLATKKFEEERMKRHV